MINNYEEKYWELREEVERTFDKYAGTKDRADYDKYILAQNIYFGYCTTVLSMLMEENSDVLKRLKQI